MNRSAQSPNTIVLYFIGFLVLVLISVPLIVMPSHFIKQAFNNQTMITALGNTTSSTVVQNMSKIPRVVDGFFAAGFIIIAAFLIITAYYSDNAPGYFLIFYLVLSAIFLVSLPVINAVKDATDSTALSSFFLELPMTMFLVNHWLVVEFSFGLIIAAALYSKRASGGVQ